MKWYESVELELTRRGPQWQELMGRAYNPPTIQGQADEERFNGEFDEVLEDLLGILSKAGTLYRSVDDEADYSVNFTHNFSRWIEVCLWTEKLFALDLAPVLASYVSEVQPDYAFWLTTDYQGWVDSDAWHPTLDIIFTRGKVLASVYNESYVPDLARFLGVPDFAKRVKR